MLNAYYELYYHEPNNCVLLSEIVVSEFEYILKAAGMCVNMISFSQPGFM